MHKVLLDLLLGNVMLSGYMSKHGTSTKAKAWVTFSHSINIQNHICTRLQTVNTSKFCVFSFHMYVHALM